MKRILGLMLGVACLIGVAQAEVVAPDVLIRSTVQDVQAIIKQDKDIQSGNLKKIQELVDAKVLPNFDFRHMTFLAVGKYWRTATPDQKDALVDGFRGLLVRTYSKAFAEFRDYKVEVLPFKMASDDTEVTVKSKVNKPGGQPIPVDYKLKKTPDGWKAFDIYINGISIVLSNRTSFESEVQQNGVDGLIKMLASMKASSAGTQQKADAK